MTSGKTAGEQGRVSKVVEKERGRSAALQRPVGLFAVTGGKLAVSCGELLVFELLGGAAELRRLVAELDVADSVLW